MVRPLLVLSALGLALALAAPAAGAAPAEPASSDTGPKRRVDLTTDSAPGWVPSEELEAQVRQAAADYVADEDSVRYPQAYARQSEAHRQRLSLDDYQKIAAALAEQTGPVVERHITAITWTKDPSNNDPAHAAPPGVYAAVDLVGRYAKADRYCGYLVLYQPPDGGAFTVMREEVNVLDNATAKSLGAKGAKAAWTQASASCPHYKAP